MKWTDVPFLLRLPVAVGVAFVVVKVGCALLGYLAKISVKENPPEKNHAQYEQYMLLFITRRVFMFVFYFGALLGLLFVPLVVNQVSNASIGHLILFGTIAAMGMSGNLIGWIQQKKCKR